MAADEEFGYFRGEGGSVWRMSLPLPEVMEEKLTKGYLQRVNEDGTPYSADGGAHGVLPKPGEHNPPDDGELPEPPARTASKAEWVGYAVHVGGMAPDDADAMTKADLIEEFG